MERQGLFSTSEASVGWFWTKIWHSLDFTPSLFQGSFVFRLRSVHNSWVPSFQKFTLALKEGAGRNGSGGEGDGKKQTTVKAATAGQWGWCTLVEAGPGCRQRRFPKVTSKGRRAGRACGKEEGSRGEGPREMSCASP